MRALLLIILYTVATLMPVPAKGLASDSLSAPRQESAMIMEFESFGPADLTEQSWFKRNHVADNLEVAVTLGTTGAGLEIATPVTKWVKMRAGIDWFPKVSVPLHFNLNTFSDNLPSNNINHVIDMVYRYTGIEMDDKVEMIGKPDMLNFKLLFDVYPFQENRHWHFTAGFYSGNSRIGTAINNKKEMPTLVGLNIYNRGYEYFTHITDINDVPIGGGIYMSPDMVEKVRDRFLQYGRIGIPIGYFSDGKPYIMEPAPDGTISAKAFVNHFKPYVGFGYDGNLDKTGNWKIGVEAGVLFWGGAPKVINHDYANDRDVDFTTELHNIRGKVGTYMDFIRAFPVYPAINLRISYSFF